MIKKISSVLGMECARQRERQYQKAVLSLSASYFQNYKGSAILSERRSYCLWADELGLCWLTGDCRTKEVVHYWDDGWDSTVLYATPAYDGKSQPSNAALNLAKQPRRDKDPLG